MDLDFSNAYGGIARHDAQVRPARQRPAAERASDDGPAPLDVERAVDGETHRASGQRNPAGIGHYPVAEGYEPGPQVRNSLAGGSRHNHDRHPGERRGRESGCNRLAHFTRPGFGDEICLGNGHERMPHRQCVEQVDVLVGLRTQAVIGGHHEQGRVDLAGTHEHVADEPVVAGDVDEVQLGPVGQREVRVPDVDGHPAATLLRKAIGVDAGERAQERRLAVVDVAGRADDHGHGSRARPSAAAIAPEPGQRVLQYRAEIEDDPAVPDAGQYARRATSQGRHHPIGRTHGERHAPGRQRLTGQRPAADGGADLDDRGRACAVEGGGERLGSLAECLQRHGDHLPDRDRAFRAAGPIQPERGSHGGERRLVRSHRSRQRVLAHPRNEVRAPDDQPGLRTADQLVAAERDNVRTGRKPLAWHRLVGEPKARPCPGARHCPGRPPRSRPGGGPARLPRGRPAPRRTRAG